MFVVKQPQAVWRLSGRRGPSAKEILIGIHQRAQGEWQVEQEYEFGHERERDAEFGNMHHHSHQMVEVRRARLHQILYRGKDCGGNYDLDNNVC
jgi:hypothetical protein